MSDRDRVSVAPEPATGFRLAVGIATKGRASVLCQTVARLRRQTRMPDRVIVCGTDASDVEGLQAYPEVEIRLTKAGLCRQRNEIIGCLSDCEIILFIDDDFFLSPDYVAVTLSAFETDASIVVTTGHVIADGAVGPGLAGTRADTLLAADLGQPVSRAIEPAWNGYGCNMALRLAVLRRHDLRFDERLPLYGWFEDVDLTRRLGRFGRIVKVNGARGVHLGVKVGRTSGLRLGYSQVANPIYLARKGVYPWRRVARDIGRHLLVNCAKSLRPEPFVDRRGRLVGNMRGFGDLIRGRLRPERILAL